MEVYSNTVSAIMVPHGIDGADVIDAAFRRYNLALGAGSLQGFWQAVPHRTSGGPQRFNGTRRTRRGRNGDARCRYRPDLGKWRCGSAGALPQDHHGERKKTHRAGTLRTDTSRRRFPSVAGGCICVPLQTGDKWVVAFRVSLQEAHALALANERQRRAAHH